MSTGVVPVPYVTFVEFCFHRNLSSFVQFGLEVLNDDEVYFDGISTKSVLLFTKV